MKEKKDEDEQPVEINIVHFDTIKYKCLGKLQKGHGKLWSFKSKRKRVQTLIIICWCI